VTPRIEMVVVLDCRDVRRLADFWTAALGYRVEGAVGRYTALRPPDGASGPSILLQRVPEPKSGKNRLHLDLRVADLDGELARLLSLGAHRLSDVPVHEDGWTWWVLADPEGNEFCVLRPLPRTAT
jgi:predicted enzyme related to lactoylglutathione lyase